MNKTYIILTLLVISCATMKKDDISTVTPPTKESSSILVPETPKSLEEQKEQKFDEVGLSSWYGEQFHNKPTASGELFDRFKLTAAHRTLPFGTSVKIQNLDNQKETLVRINDRGPYNKARIIDVSERAAEILDFKEVGVARVGLTIVREPNENLAQNTTQKESSTESSSGLVRDDDSFTLEDDEEEEDEDDDEDLLSPPRKDQKKPVNPIPEKKSAPSKTAPSKTTELQEKSQKTEEEKSSKLAGQPKGFTVQIGVFKEKRRAENFKAQVASNFKENIFIFNRAGTFVVQIGDFSTRAEAVALRDRLKARGIFGFIPPR